MFGFYQFKDDKYYNAPIGDGAGLSIFPYRGVNNNTPYSRPIPIRKARYSKSTLDNSNADKPAGVLNSQHSGGPIPYIYKARITGISGTSSCNTTNCSDLNDRDFYLYGVEHGPGFASGVGRYNYGCSATWENTFTDDFHPHGIFLHTGIGAFSEVNMASQIGSNFYDIISLMLFESLDTDVDKSWLVLTLRSSTFNSVLEYQPTVLPLIFYKEFGPDERIFALEEEIVLSPTSYLTIDHGVVSTPGPHTYSVLESNQLCDFLSASVTLSPYQTTKYDIRNNYNTYANMDNYGLMKNDNSHIQIPTSSGTMTVNTGYKKVPGCYDLSFSGIATRNQGQHVPCDIFFNRTFNLKAYENTGDLNLKYNVLGNANVVYAWDNEIETYLYHNDLENRRNYVGLGVLSYRATQIGYEEVEPYLDNIHLIITSGYLQLDLIGSIGNLSFRSNNTPTTNLQTNVFNTWYLHDDAGTLNDYCNFDSPMITLTPIDTNFRQSDYTLSCIPLCDDNTTPTLANITVRISGWIQSNMERVNINTDLNIITDLESVFFRYPNNIGGVSHGEYYFGTLHYQDYSSNTMHYWCDKATSNLFPGTHTAIESGVTGIYGEYIQIPMVSGNYQWNESTPPFTVHNAHYAIRQLPIIQSQLIHLYDATGCPQRQDCTIPFSFNYPSARNMFYQLTGGGFGHSSLMSYSGTVTFDGFV